ncbi:MAG TPA: nucleoside triphosphate pyrophosphatase [Isosphaeraceae bacterium]|nr:nucleoside triphosphate pyrophosphatase [Isosphaeraceae bacterium]
MSIPLILASASPRRRQLLAAAGYEVIVDPSMIDEPLPLGPVEPADYAAELAWRKAAAVARRHERGLILAADTVCAVDDLILGKPDDRDDAERMIRLQEGRRSDVLTALCLRRADRPEWVGAVETTVIDFRPLTDPERRDYLDSGLWSGKAGGYGIQDAGPFVRVVRGSWSNVVGLPMERLKALLRDYSSLIS